MIAISSREGQLIRNLPLEKEATFGFHEVYGFVSEKAAKERLIGRKLNGVPFANRKGYKFQFKVVPIIGGDLDVQAVSGCEAKRAGKGAWALETPMGQFTIGETIASELPPWMLGEGDDKPERLFLWATLLAFLLIGLILVIGPQEKIEIKPEVIPEPITIKIEAQKEKVVVVPAPNELQEMKNTPIAKTTNQAKRAIQQNLGFLGLLGNKNLSKAIGGAKTSLSDASPGAGPGGKEGSGGELLVGLGQGVKKTTVGNSGVKGLGGVGTKGVGGGGGGYGNSMVGSGEGGRGLSTVALSQDITLEGGLERAVIQATIAKYLNQVRACYEAGLKRNAGMAGQVSMNFEIGPSGMLNSSKVGRSTLGDGEVEDCIATKMMSWQFPKPRGGVNVKVNYPFMLRPVTM